MAEKAELLVEIISGLSTGEIIKCSTCRESFVNYASKSQDAPMCISSADVFRLMRPALEHLDHEETYMIHLDVTKRAQRIIRISLGSLNASIVHPREAFRQAVKDSSHSVILVHNHPSGSPTPSDEDVALTHRMRSAGEVLGITLLDHIIWTEREYYSFSDAGRMR